MKKERKIIFIALTFLILIRIGYIWTRSELNRSYKAIETADSTTMEEIPCSAVSQEFTLDHDYLNSIEIMFSGIPEDKQGSICLRICREDTLVYQTNISLGNINNWEWKKIYTNIPILKNQKYNLRMDISENCTQIPNILYADGQMALRYIYLEEPGVVDKAISTSIWLLFFLLMYIVFKKIDDIINYKKRIITAIYSYIPCDVFNVFLEVLLCMVILECSGIPFQGSTKVLLYTISLLSAYGINLKNNIIKSLFSTDIKRVVLFAIYVYATIALVGQRVLLYPLDRSVTLAGISMLLLTYVWVIPVVNSVIYIICRIGDRKVLNVKSMNSIQFIFILVSGLLVLAIYSLAAYNPGMSSPDTYATMVENAKNLYGMYNWHPAFYCMVLKVIEKIWDSTYAVILVQYFFWMYVWVELFLYLRRKGINDYYLIILAFFVGVNPGNFLHINTIWKDIPYALSILWTLVLLAKLSIDYEEYKKKWYIYLELIVALVGVCLYRKNGIVSFVIIAFASVIVLRKNIRLVLSILLSIGMVCFIEGPVYQYFAVEDTGRYGMYIGLGQDILGVYYANGEVSEETVQMVTVMTDFNNAEYNYLTTYSNQSYDLDIEPLKFICNYLDTFIKNPILMLRAIINREDALWDIFLGSGAYLQGPNSTGTMDGQGAWNDYYPARKYISITKNMSIETAYSASNQWISAVVWRSGLFMLLGLIALMTIWSKKGIGKYVIISAPLFGHIISLLLTTGWSDYRYFWPTNLMNFSIIILSAVIIKSEVGKI